MVFVAIFMHTYTNKKHILSQILGYHDQNKLSGPGDKTYQADYFY